MGCTSSAKLTFSAYHHLQHDSSSRLPLDPRHCFIARLHAHTHWIIPSALANAFPHHVRFSTVVPVLLLTIPI